MDLNSMDEFEARIDERLSRLERGDFSLIDGLEVPDQKDADDISEWARRLASDVSGLHD